MRALVLMSSISHPITLPAKHQAMIDKLNNNGLTWHVSQYTKYTSSFVLWSSEGCHREYTWLSTPSVTDILMAIEYLYYHRIGGPEVEWRPINSHWVDKGYKALVNLP